MLWSDDSEYKRQYTVWYRVSFEISSIFFYQLDRSQHVEISRIEIIVIAF
jgi:hypothetical protein